MPRKRQGYRSFAVLHKDDDLLVVTKPSGLLTNMAEDGEQTLEDQVRSTFGPRATPAHRLDRYTSGAVVFGRTPEALSALGRLMADGAIEKTYWVLTVGTPNPEEGCIDAPIERFEHPRKKMRVAEGEHAKEARTDYSVAEELSGFALVHARLHTGRTHQLRVHFAHVGTPVAGDNIYGDRKANAVLRQEHGLQRQFIHARELCFDHPSHHREIRVSAKLPKDLSRVLKSLRGTT